MFFHPKNLKSENNNPLFKPWFNILLHTQSIVCATVDSWCLEYLGYITLIPSQNKSISEANTAVSNDLFYRKKIIFRLRKFADFQKRDITNKRPSQSLVIQTTYGWNPTNFRTFFRISVTLWNVVHTWCIAGGVKIIWLGHRHKTRVGHIPGLELSSSPYRRPS